VGQRHVAHDGNAVLLGDFDDLVGPQVQALGRDPRRAHGVLVVLDGDGDVVRVHHHHGGFPDVLDGVVLGDLPEQALALVLGVGVAFLLLVLLFHLFLRHLHVLHEHLFLDEEIGRGHHEEENGHVQEQLEHERAHQLGGLVERVLRGEHDVAEVLGDDHVHQDDHDRHLEDGFGQLDVGRGLEKDLLESFHRIELLQVGLERLHGEQAAHLDVGHEQSQDKHGAEDRGADLQEQ